MSDPDKDNTLHSTTELQRVRQSANMTQSPLALKRRREAERPPGMSTKRNSNENKEKRKSSTDSSVVLDYIYLVVGFLWYSLLGLWRTPGEDQYEARLTVSKALYTPSQFLVKIQRQQGASFGTNPPLKLSSQDRTFRGEVRNHGQQEVYEALEVAIKREGKDNGQKGYFLVSRLGYDRVAVDPDHLIPNQNW